MRILYHLIVFGSLFVTSIALANEKKKLSCNPPTVTDEVPFFLSTKETDNLELQKSDDLNVQETAIKAKENWNTIGDATYKVTINPEEDSKSEKKSIEISTRSYIPKNSIVTMKIKMWKKYQKLKKDLEEKKSKKKSHFMPIKMIKSGPGEDKSKSVAKVDLDEEYSGHINIKNIHPVGRRVFTVKRDSKLVELPEGEQDKTFAFTSTKNSDGKDAYVTRYCCEKKTKESPKKKCYRTYGIDFSDTNKTVFFSEEEINKCLLPSSDMNDELKEGVTHSFPQKDIAFFNDLAHFYQASEIIGNEITSENQNTNNPSSKSEESNEQGNLDVATSETNEAQESPDVSESQTNEAQGSPDISESETNEVQGPVTTNGTPCDAGDPCNEDNYKPEESVAINSTHCETEETCSKENELIEEPQQETKLEESSSNTPVLEQEPSEKIEVTPPPLDPITPPPVSVQKTKEQLAEERRKKKCEKSPFWNDGKESQIILNLTNDWNSNQSFIYQAKGKAGKITLESEDPILSTIGKNGMAIGASPDNKTFKASKYPKKSQDDYKTPAGIFSLYDSFGIGDQDKTGSNFPYKKTSKHSVCVNDKDSKGYNRNYYGDVKSGFFRRRKDPPKNNSSIPLKRDDQQYDLAITFGQNEFSSNEWKSERAQNNGGACLFMHVWDEKKDLAERQTNGSTAMSMQDLTKIHQWIDPKLKPQLVQLPLSVYREKKNEWCLPSVPEVNMKNIEMIGRTENRNGNQYMSYSSHPNQQKRLSPLSRATYEVFNAQYGSCDMEKYVINSKNTSFGKSHFYDSLPKNECNKNIKSTDNRWGLWGPTVCKKDKIHAKTRIDCLELIELSMARAGMKFQASDKGSSSCKNYNDRSTTQFVEGKRYQKPDSCLVAAEFDYQSPLKEGAILISNRDSAMGHAVSIDMIEDTNDPFGYKDKSKSECDLLDQTDFRFTIIQSTAGNNSSKKGAKFVLADKVKGHYKGDYNYDSTQKKYIATKRDTGKYDKVYSNSGIARMHASVLSDSRFYSPLNKMGRVLCHIYHSCNENKFSNKCLNEMKKGKAKFGGKLTIEPKTKISTDRGLVKSVLLNYDESVPGCEIKEENKTKFDNEQCIDKCEYRDPQGKKYEYH